MEEVYMPAEDSYLLQDHIKDFARGSVLDMGTGSGVQAIEASKYAEKVLAVDKNPAALKHARKQAKGIMNISFKASDLFKTIPKQKFDLIIFNPPYLPVSKHADDIALCSPKGGTETITMFLGKAGDYLAPDGVILLVYSSITKKAHIDASLQKNLLQAELISKKHVFFEDILLFKIEKAELRKRLEAQGFLAPEVYAKGKRGVILTATHKKKKVAIKIKKETSEAQGTIENEVRFLKLLNEMGIGPKLIYYDHEKFAYEFAEGDFIEDYLRNSGAKDIRTVLARIVRQLYAMDKAGINKFEMHHPVKHIIVKGTKPVMIDFERCRHTEHPKNVTQFLDYLRSLKGILDGKGISIDEDEIKGISLEYRHSAEGVRCERIVRLLKKQ
jgi:release factor glutamine methyltransferase